MTIRCLIISFCFSFPCIAQEYRGGEFSFSRLDQHRYNVEVNLFYNGVDAIPKSCLSINPGTGIIDTACLVANELLTSDIRRFTYQTTIFFPVEAQTYLVYVTDTIFLPDLVNLGGNGRYKCLLQTPLTIPNSQFFGLNSPPAFNLPPVDFSFSDGMMTFDAGASDAFGDTLFYGLRDFNTPGFYDYQFPAAGDTFFINAAGLITWKKPLVAGKYLLGISVAKYTQFGYFLGELWRDFIIEVKETDIAASWTLDNYIPIKIFPNPADDVLNIVASSALQSEVTCRLYNSLGQVVKDIRFQPSNEAYTIPVNDLSSGIYGYNMYAGGTVVKNGKVIIVRS